MTKVILLAAVTADGFIARHANHTADWTSAEDKKLFVELTKKAGVMIMGATTFNTIGRALPGRRTILLTRSPEKYKNMNVDCMKSPPEVIVQELDAKGVKEVVVCGGASVYGQFMAAGVVDELYLTVEPFLFGTGVPLFNEKLDEKLNLLEVRKLNESTVLLHYAVNKK